MTGEEDPNGAVGSVGVQLEANSLGVDVETAIDPSEEIQAWAWVVQRLEHSSTRSMGSAVRHLLRFRCELSQEESEKKKKKSGY